MMNGCRIWRVRACFICDLNDDAPPSVRSTCKCSSDALQGFVYERRFTVCVQCARIKNLRIGCLLLLLPAFFAAAAAVVDGDDAPIRLPLAGEFRTR